MRGRAWAGPGEGWKWGESLVSHASEAAQVGLVPGVCVQG